MGMDLIGNWRGTTPQEIKNKNEYGANLHYNWTGWGWLVNQLEEWGVNTEEFSGSNDGEVLSRKTCKTVAEAIEQHIEKLPETDQYWLKNHIEVWKWTTRFKQY